MRSHRIPAADVRVGDIFVRVGAGPSIDRRVNEIRPCTPGQRVRGARGGGYELTVAGAAVSIVLVTAGSSPVVTRAAAVTVLRDDPTDV